MKAHAIENLVTFRDDCPIWERVFTVNPLVLIGTQERDGGYNLAPKHMAFPMGWENYFGFVCTPRHFTYHNARREGVFTVSYPRPTQVVLASLAASPREDDGAKPSAPCRPSRRARWMGSSSGRVTCSSSAFWTGSWTISGRTASSRAASWRRTSIGTTFASLRETTRT